MVETCASNSVLVRLVLAGDANQTEGRSNCVAWSRRSRRCKTNRRYVVLVERSSSVVECQTCNREPGFESHFATVSKFGHFRSLHDASVDSAV